jgi:hypothetical protein
MCAAKNAERCGRWLVGGCSRRPSAACVRSGACAAAAAMASCCRRYTHTNAPVAGAAAPEPQLVLAARGVLHNQLHAAWVVYPWQVLLRDGLRARWRAQGGSTEADSSMSSGPAGLWRSRRREEAARQLQRPTGTADHGRCTEAAVRAACCACCPTQAAPRGCRHTLGTTTRPEADTSLEVSCFSKKTLAPMSSSARTASLARHSLSICIPQASLA